MPRLSVRFSGLKAINKKNYFLLNLAMQTIL
jgi:hypothetical protein